MILTKEKREARIARFKASLRAMYQGGEKVDENKIAKKIEDLEGLRTVKLTLAFEPEKKDLKKLTRHFSKEAILDLNVDESLLGGAVIEYQGRYLDHSLLKKIDDVI